MGYFNKDDDDSAVRLNLVRMNLCETGVSESV
jgi:hypothetical protein